MSHANNDYDYARFILELSHYRGMISDAGDSNYLIHVRRFLKIVLDFAGDIDIHSVPGNERDRIYELQTLCIAVEGLLLRPSVPVSVIRAGCRETSLQVFYLMALLSIGWATALEALCPL